MKALVLILSLSLLCFQASSSPHEAGRDLSDSSGTVFDVTKLGAKPDGKTDNSEAIMKAWRSACKSGGPATLRFPPGNYMFGEIVFQGPCDGYMTIDIQGKLISSSDLSLFTQGVWIEVESVNGVTVTGGGTLDGQGDQVWKYAPKKSGGSVLLPISLQFSKVQNGYIQYLKVVNSKGFHTKVTGSSKIKVTDLTITAPGDSPNTDGLHISSSSDVTVSNLVVGTGDDCISIGEGTSNIAVYNITCGPGHGISIGSLGKYPDETDVKGITVRNCKFKNTTNGARIKTYHASPVLKCSGIVFENIEMEAVQNPILIDQHYFSKKVDEPSRVQISDVQFRNFWGTTSSPVAVTMNCSEAVPCQGVQLTDIYLKPTPGTDPLTATCYHAKPTVAGEHYVHLSSCADV